ncbi:MAG: hypothetical protein IVW55_02445 [Chloroflexi bacterium]|nr:hypothetical protein [Chloroflexota bacterium]
MEDKNRHLCPQCGYEYEPWIEVCPDCNVSIGRPLPPQESGDVVDRLGPDEDPEWTVATNVPNAIIGNLLRSQLQDAGIPVLMLRAPSADIGQFTGNDFVPYDLRVPRHFLEQARQLVYSAPSENMTSQPWEAEFDDANVEQYESEGTEQDRPSRSTLPQGWSMIHNLPNQQETSNPENQEPGWYWADGDQEQAGGGSYLPKSEAYSSKQSAGLSSRRHNDYNTHYTGPPPWIRIIYGILLAAISLPFILQVLQQIWSMFGLHR